MSPGNSDFGRHGPALAPTHARYLLLLVLGAFLTCVLADSDSLMQQLTGPPGRTLSEAKGPGYTKQYSARLQTGLFGRTLLEAKGPGFTKPYSARLQTGLFGQTLSEAEGSSFTKQYFDRLHAGLFGQTLPEAKGSSFTKQYSARLRTDAPERVSSEEGGRDLSNEVFKERQKMVQNLTKAFDRVSIEREGRDSYNEVSTERQAIVQHFTRSSSDNLTVTRKAASGVSSAVLSKGAHFVPSQSLPPDTAVSGAQNGSSPTILSTVTTRDVSFAGTPIIKSQMVQNTATTLATTSITTKVRPSAEAKAEDGGTSTSMGGSPLTSVPPSDRFTKDNITLTRECMRKRVTFKATAGVVYEVRVSDDFRPRLSFNCDFFVEAPRGMLLLANITRHTEENQTFCTNDVIEVYYQNPSNRYIFMCLENSGADFVFFPTPIVVSSSNHLGVKYYVVPRARQRPFHRFNFTFKIQTLEESVAQQLPVKRTSSRSGFMTSLGYDGVHGYPKHHDNWGKIDVPSDNDVMVSFPKFDIDEFYPDCDSYVELYLLETDAKERRVWRKCREKVVPARVYRASGLILKMHSARRTWSVTGFKMCFSFHAPERTPEELHTGVFNCSVDYYPSFRQHLDCNLEPECDGGQDETHHCPYSSPVCPGKVAAGSKCYFFGRSKYPNNRFNFHRMLPWSRIDELCRDNGGQLAVVKNGEELKDFRKLFHYGKRLVSRILVGSRMGFDSKIPYMYSKILRWTDGSLVFSLRHVRVQHSTVFHSSRTFCLIYSVYTSSLIPHRCSFSEYDLNHAVCETNVQMAKRVDTTPINFPLQLELSSKRRLSIALARCPKGHLTRLFLACDMRSECDTEGPVSHCPFTTSTFTDTPLPLAVGVLSVAMFACDDEITTIPYTLVCDFKHDCQDRSDELFCRHPVCDGFHCSNGQCIDKSQRCNNKAECRDASDQKGCTETITIDDHENDPGKRLPPPAIINFDGNGRFSVTTMERSQPCPNTHYRCPGEWDYCLPVYTRCNGFYDCLDREDEENCEEVTCPGFYRCRASSVCVHPDHLCDGWPQCPQHDDELLCGWACPDGCLCHGLALLCLSFQAWLTDVRYLDASGSTAALSHISGGHYLIHLVLVGCLIDSLPLLSLPNLHVLDLSDNRLTSVNMSVFIGFPNLKVLRMSGNPLAVLTLDESNNSVDTLRVLDLSRTQLVHFDSRVLAVFHLVKHLNLSFTPIRSVGEGGFGSIQRLAELDLRECPLKHFPSDVFQGLTQLRSIFTANYRLCCADVLPRQQESPDCRTQQSKLSSCENVLRSKSHQFYFFLVASLALICNVVCVVRHCLVRDEVPERAFSILITNLHTANFIMSLYTGIVVTADVVFDGKYRNEEELWKSSVACAVAGFLSVLSSETSLLAISLLTLDRLMVLFSRFTRFSFGTVSAAAACVMTWLVGFVLAGVPLLPVAAHWQVYQQSGICIPLSGAQPDFTGRGYWFSLHACFNLCLCFLTLLGQAFVYRVVHTETRKVKLEKTSKHILLARRLLNSTVVGVLAPLFLGVNSLIGYVSGCSTSEENDVVLTVFVLPLHSALNPLLYLMNVRLERRRLQTEEKLVTLLRSRVVGRIRGAPA